MLGGSHGLVFKGSGTEMAYRDFEGFACHADATMVTDHGLCCSE